MTEQRPQGKKTYILDLCRSPFAGILEAGTHTFVLLIAIRYFQPGPLLKALIPACISFGLLLSPVMLSFASKKRMRATHWASLFFMCGGLLMLSASFAESLSVFLLCVAPSLVCCAFVPMFMIFSYSENYTARQRGQRIATFFVVSSLVSGIFAFSGGHFLDLDLENFRWVLRAIAMAAISSSVLSYFIPSPFVERRHSASPFQNISLSWKDRLFGWILLAWMCIGIANLMTIPLRVEYMASPKYGINASNETITLVIVLVPSIFRVISTRIWGLVFDRINLLTLRCILNALLTVSIFTFFRAETLGVFVFASIVHGIAHGGGNVAWNLWVTKIAPPEQTGAYMSVHTAFTGVRGFLSPFIGFLVISQFGPILISPFAVVLAIVSILIQLPLIRHPRLLPGAIAPDVR